MIYCIFCCIIRALHHHHHHPKAHTNTMLFVLLKFKKVAADNLSVRQQRQFHIAVGLRTLLKEKNKTKQMILMIFMGF